MTSPDHPWSVPVAIHEVPETGKSFALTADEPTRAAIAKLAGLRSLPRLEATFDVSPRGRDALNVVGRIVATVGQTCVVTLDPIENEIEEDIDLVFAPAAAPVLIEEDGAQVEIAALDAPEPLIGGRLDLGSIATEFLMLAINPHPRKPDAVFEAPSSGEGGGHPFAALAALKKGRGDKGG